MVYAGGIVVLYVFSILLTSGEGDRAEKLKRSRFLAGLFTMVAGLAIILFITLKHNFMQTANLAPHEINIHAIGTLCLVATNTVIYCLSKLSVYPVAGLYHRWNHNCT